MPIVETTTGLELVGGLRDYGAQLPTATAIAGPTTRHYETGAYWTYQQIYERQPNVRTVIDFLARNLAQLKFHVYRRVSDSDRQRLIDYPLARWLTRPNPLMTRYRLFETTIQDFCIYWCAYWLKVRTNTGVVSALVRLPPDTIEVDGWISPSRFYWTWPDGMTYTLLPQDLVYFSGYSPVNPILGISPLETLRRTLQEEAAATQYRQSFWENAARIEGIIERPATAEKWTNEKRTRFRELWEHQFSGVRNAGRMAVLEEGMTWKNTSYSARDAEYISAKKLTREEVAAQYHVPLTMVGILEHATFTNIIEQRKQLYGDTLAPWCAMLEEEIMRQLLPECPDWEDVYVEANIAEKLKGQFEEQAASIQTLTGRPVMTPNEARARLNLPSIKDDPTADELARPLNMTSVSANVPAPQTPSRVVVPGV